VEALGVGEREQIYKRRRKHRWENADIGEGRCWQNTAWGKKESG
jgi:hypothetical protein